MPEALWFNPAELLIGRQWRASASGDSLPVVNPSDGSVLGQIARGNADDIDAAVAAAQAALDGPWGRLSALERGRLLVAIGRKVLERTDELAELEALDVGKPLKQARADVLALEFWRWPATWSFMVVPPTRLPAKRFRILMAIRFTPCASRMV